MIEPVGVPALAALPGAPEGAGVGNSVDGSSSCAVCDMSSGVRTGRPEKMGRFGFHAHARIMTSSVPQTRPGPGVQPAAGWPVAVRACPEPPDVADAPTGAVTFFSNASRMAAPSLLSSLYPASVVEVTPSRPPD